MLDGGKLFREKFVQNVIDEVKHVQNPRFVLKSFWNSGIVDDLRHNSFVIAWDDVNSQWSVQSIPWIEGRFRSHTAKYSLNRTQQSSTWHFAETEKIVQLMYHCFSLEVSDLDLEDFFCEVNLYEMGKDGFLKMLYCSKNADAITLDRWLEIVEHMLEIVKLITEGSKPIQQQNGERPKKRVKIITEPIVPLL